jgi:putative addiction module killer protein
MLPLKGIEVLEYVEPDGRSPYAEWFDSLNPPAAAKAVIAVTRLAQGNRSKTKSVGGGVHEYKIDFGPGYRVYFGREGERLISAAGRWNQEATTKRHCGRS